MGPNVENEQPFRVDILIVNLLCDLILEILPGSHVLIFLIVHGKLEYTPHNVPKTHKG